MSVVWSEVFIAKSVGTAFCAGLLFLLDVLYRRAGAFRPEPVGIAARSECAMPASEGFLEAVHLDVPGARIASPPGTYRRRAFQPVEVTVPEISFLHQRCETGSIGSWL